MVVTALLLIASALGAEVHATVSRGDGPSTVHQSRHTAVVDWDGGSADVWLGRDGRWTLIATRASFPLDVPRVEPGDTVRIAQGDAIEADTEVSFVWTPYDVAAWSGPGLRGARVSTLAPATRGLWAGSEGGGLALWDGERWAHLDRRVAAFSEHVRHVALDGNIRWITTATHVVRLSPDGVRRTWAVDRELPAGELRATQPTTLGAWVASSTGLLRIHEDGSARTHETSECTGFGIDTKGEPVALCQPIVSLAKATPTADVPADLHPIATVPSGRGLWAATPHQGVWLHTHAGWMQRLPSWSPPLHDAARIGTHLAIATHDDGLLLLGADDTVGVRPADGLPSLTVRTLAPGPTPTKLWAGTHRGVALVNEGGTATALPLAPVPAGVGVRQIVPTKQGLALVTEDGLRWVGPKMPPGWRDLQAAAIAPRGLISVARGWWVGTATGGLHLDRRGALTRYEVHAEVTDVVRTAQGVAFVSPEGVRAWIDGATTLSPILRHAGLRHADTAPGGGLWLATDSEVTYTGGASTARTWPIDGIHDLHATGPGAVLATDAGLVWLNPSSDATPTGWRHAQTGGVVALDDADGRLWVAGADGRIWHDGPDGPRAQLLPQRGDASVLTLVADADGAWVGTDRGLFRVSLQRSKASSSGERTGATSPDESRDSTPADHEG